VARRLSEIAAEAAATSTASKPSEASAAPAKPVRRGQPLSLKGRALQLLTGREHSRLELERKLAEHAPSPGELAALLDDLQAKGFISEARVIDSVVNRRATRFGAARIRHELQGKGLAPEAVAAAVQSLKGSELERAREVWRKKFHGPPGDAAERGKQMRFLAARGFGGDVIRRVVAGIDDD
jgi:regulatory protein